MNDDKAQAIANFVVNYQIRLKALMSVKGIDDAELARKLGMSKDRVTALFGDHANLTLETVGRILYALGERGELTIFHGLFSGPRR